MNETVSYWTRPAIKRAIGEWVEEYGEIPRSTDWENIGGTKWPSYNAVITRFGSWNESIRAAGFVPRPTSRPGRHIRDEQIRVSTVLDAGTHRQLVEVCDKGAIKETHAIRLAISEWLDRQ